MAGALITLNPRCLVIHSTVSIRDEHIFVSVGYLIVCALRSEMNIEKTSTISMRLIDEVVYLRTHDSWFMYLERAECN